MSQIKQCELALSKNTVKAYLSKLESLKVDLDELLCLEDPKLETRFHAGNPAYMVPAAKEI